MAQDPDKGWQLPETVNPLEHWCYRINIPKDIAYLRAFRGTVSELGFHWNWQRDESETAKDVVQVWLTQIAEAETLISEDNCMAITCAEIVACIENDPAVRQAVQDAMAGLTNTPGLPSNYQQSAFDPVVGCDKDVTYGYCKALWQYIDAVNIDILEVLNEATNQAEAINTLLKIIPAFEQIPVSDVLAWITNLGEYNLDAYNASKTVGLEQQIICDLFCIAVNKGCTITFEDVWDYMLIQFGGFNFPTLGATFLELVVFMVTGVYPSDRIVYLWSLVQLGFAFIGTEYLGTSGVQQYALQAQAGNPDNEWSVLCATCTPTITITFDEITDPAWDVTDGNSNSVTVITPNVLQSNANGNPIPSFELAFVTTGSFEGRNGFVDVVLTDVQDVTSVDFDYHFIKPGNNVVNRTIILLDDQDMSIESWSTSADDAVKGSWTTIARPFSASNVKTIRVFMSIVQDPATITPANCQIFIDNIVIRA